MWRSSVSKAVLLLLSTFLVLTCVDGKEKINGSLEKEKNHEHEEEEYKSFRFVSCEDQQVQFELCTVGVAICEENRNQNHDFESTNHNDTNNQKENSNNNPLNGKCTTFTATISDYATIFSMYKDRNNELLCRRCESCDEDSAETFLPERLVESCETCQMACEKINNANENGYVDAAEFTECRRIPNLDGIGDGNLNYFGGPVCHEVIKIAIGLFDNDANCRIENYEPSKHLDDYLVDEEGFMMKLAYFNLIRASRPECQSCKLGWDNSVGATSQISLCDAWKLHSEDM